MTKMVVLDPGVAQKRLPELVPYIERSIRASQGTITGGHIAKLLVVGDATAITVEDGADIHLVLTVREVQYPEYKVLRILSISGTRLKDAHRLLGDLKLYAMARGCDEIEAFCRPAMFRLLRRLNWQTKFIVLKVNLRN